MECPVCQKHIKLRTLQNVGYVQLTRLSEADGACVTRKLCLHCWKAEKRRHRKEALVMRKTLTEAGVCSDLVGVVRSYLTDLPVQRERIRRGYARFEDGRLRFPDVTEELL
jgi:hypothetical protein